MDKVYSYDEELYNSYSVGEAVHAFVERYWPVQVGDIITIWQGTPVPQKASNFVYGGFVDSLGECAWDECGEWVDDWPGCTVDQEQVLLELVLIPAQAGLVQGQP